MKLRLALLVLGLAACQGSRGTEDITLTADTSIPVETAPEHTVAPTEPRKPARFAMVGPKTVLRAGPSHEAASIDVTEPAMVMAVDGEQPDNPTWVRLVQTPLKSRCGYPSLKTTTAVYAERASLLQTLTEDFVYEVPGKTEARVVLRAGVALQARDKKAEAGTDYEIAIVPPGGGNRVRATLPLTASTLPRVINGAQLTKPLPGEPVKPAASVSTPATPPPAPSSSPAASLRAAASPPSRIAVGKYVVRLPKKNPPRVTRAAGPKPETDHVTLKSGCLEVVGYAPSAHAGLVALLAAPVPPSSIFGPSTGLSAKVTGLDNLIDAQGVAVGSGGLGLRGTGRGGGGRAEGLGLGRIDHGGKLHDGKPGGRGFGSGTKSRARVRIGAALVRGSLASTSVRRAVRRHTAGIRACYAQGTSRNPKLSGRVLMEFVVDASGQVTSARAIPKSKSEPNGTDLADSAVVSCVTRRLLGLRFRAPTAKGQSVVRIPLTFSI